MNHREHACYVCGRLGIASGHVPGILRLLRIVQRGREADTWGDIPRRARYVAAGDLASAELLARMRTGVVGRVQEQGDPRGPVLEVWIKGDEAREEPTYRVGAVGFTAAEMARIERARR